ncbi:hypothetical protein BDV06DRAFT_207180, partial [Aspergillus oleicola]
CPFRPRTSRAVRRRDFHLYLGRRLLRRGIVLVLHLVLGVRGLRLLWAWRRGWVGLLGWVRSD